LSTLNTCIDEFTTNLVRILDYYAITADWHTLTASGFRVSIFLIMRSSIPMGPRYVLHRVRLSVRQVTPTFLK